MICSTSRCRRTTTSCSILTLRLISIGFSGAARLMQPPSGVASAAAASSDALRFMFSTIARLSLGWRGWRVRVDFLLDRGLGLFLVFVLAADFRGDARNVFQRPRQDFLDDLARVLERLGSRNQRAERPAD